MMELFHVAELASKPRGTRTHAARVGSKDLLILLVFNPILDQCATNTSTTYG